MVSMITINGINIVGVFWGTRCSNMWLVFLIHPNNRNLTHSGMAKVSVSVKCLVLVKTYGNNRMILFVKIIRHSEVSVNEFHIYFPFLVLELFLLLGVVCLLVSLLLYFFVIGSEHKITTATGYQPIFS
jgi:hypothetical protein